jgi:hypothetical protein
MALRDHQVTVPLPAELRQFVEQTAAREDRTVADAERMLRETGKPVGPFIECEGRYFYPRRPYRSVPQLLSEVLRRARASS